MFILIYPLLLAYDLLSLGNDDDNYSKQYILQYANV